MFGPFLPIKEGMWFIVPLGAGGIIFFFVRPEVAFLFFSLALFSCYFFRNPRRSPPQGEGLIISPADGKVLRAEEGLWPICGRKGKVVSVFMSLWDVHVNRAPFDGEVEDQRFIKGEFLPAFQEDAPRRNQRNLLFLKGEGGLEGVLVQVAGVLARRILCWAKPGQFLRRGDPFGAIVLGSRVDLYLPEDVTLVVKVGDRVKAGETVIGYYVKGGIEDEEKKGE